MTAAYLLQSVLRTSSAWAPLIARLALAIVIFPHGAQKVLGWFNGRGFEATMDLFTNTMHIPVLFAVLAIVAEFLGPLGLFVGLGTRVAAFGIACIMAVAALMHAQHGFFMNWHATQTGEGIEFHILAIGLAVALMISGAGRLSLDRLLTGWLSSNRERASRIEPALRHASTR